MHTRYWNWIAGFGVVVIACLLWLAPAVAASPIPVRTFHTQDVVYSVATPQSGDYAVVGSRDDILYVVSREGKLLWKYRAQNSVSLVAVSPGGHYVAMIDQDNTLFLFNSKGRPLWQTSVLTSASGLAISHGAKVVVVSYPIVPLLDEYSKTGHQIRQVSIPAGGESLAVNASGSVMIVGGSDDSTYAVTPLGKVLWTFATQGQVNSVAITPHGDFVAVGSQDHYLSLLSGGQGKLLWNYNFGHEVNGVAVSDHAYYVAAATNNSDLIALFNHQGTLVWEDNTGQPNTSVGVSGSGTFLVAGSQNHSAYLIATPQALSSYRTGRLLIKFAIAGIVLLLLGIGWWGWRRYQNSPQAKETVQEILRHRISYIMLIPTFAMLLLFNYYPAVSGLYHSLYRWNPGANSFFVGLQNFAMMFHDPFLIVGIPHILIMIFFGITLSGIGVPLLVAELMFHLRSSGWQYVYRVLFIVPLVVPAVAGLLIWENIYEPNIGLLNETLRAIGLGVLAQNWLGNTHLALAALIFMAFPFTSVIGILVFYAGLLAIPSELIDAAKVDGVTLKRMIRDIHVPMLTGQFKFVLVTSVIGGLRAFGVQLVMTGGGPVMSTFVPGLEMYDAATKSSEMGYSSAISVSMFLVILVLTIIQMKYIRSSVTD
jgi:ABC-type sugar transport system permease subunit